MKKIFITIAVISLFAFAALVFAHGPEHKGGQDNMMKHGCGSAMMHEMTEMCQPMLDQKFLNETKDLRKQLHDKKFEYREAVRDSRTSPDVLSMLEKDIIALKEKISEKAPHTAMKGCSNCRCW